jgi:hypothetical protein
MKILSNTGNLYNAGDCGILEIKESLHGILTVLPFALDLSSHASPDPDGARLFAHCLLSCE